MPNKERTMQREVAVLMHKQLVVRDAEGKPTGLTPNGLLLVERLAKAAGTQNFIAGKLGITTKTFQKMLGRAEDETPARLAWEKGRSEHEQHVVNQLMAHGIKNPISLIFYSKAKLAWKENEPAAVQQNSINITLPRALSREEYYKSLGIEGPVDSRKLIDAKPIQTLTGAAGDQPLYSNKGDANAK